MFRLPKCKEKTFQSLVPFLHFVTAQCLRAQSVLNKFTLAQISIPKISQNQERVKKRKKASALADTEL